MLDFLRRGKDRRQNNNNSSKSNPNNSNSNISPNLDHSSSGNGRDPARNAAQGYTTKLTQTQPLRDRNPNPSASASNGLRRQNTRGNGGTNGVSNRRGKENATASGKKSKASKEESSGRRWGKRSDNVEPAPSRKQRRQKQPPKHEPAVLNKAVTSDRRRSVKVASPVAIGVPMASDVPKRSSPTEQSLKKPTWPHIDLAQLLQRDDVSSADVAVRRIAAAASRDHATCLKMIREGVATSLVSILRHEQTTLDMRRDATFAIAELTVLEACEEPLVSAGTVPVLVALVNPDTNPDRTTLGSACRALRNLLVGKESTAVDAARYGCVQPLLKIVGEMFQKEEETEMVREAVAAICNLSNHGKRFQSYVIKHGGLTAIGSLGMRMEDDETMFHVVNVLAEFARESKWHRLIVGKDGLLVAFRALRLAKDPDVIAEASRLIGNIAVTSKARSAVREAGGLQALIDRLSRCEPFTDIIPVYDIVRALSNVCVDSRAATEALYSRDGADILLNVYTAPNAPDKLIRSTMHALQILAHGSAMRRSRVLYSIGLQVKQSSVTGLPPSRLYDLRQVILEDGETGDRDNNVAMPESLERLSRASVRMINSGVVNYGRSPQLGKKIVQNNNANRAHHANRVDKESANRPTANGARIPDHVSEALSPEKLARKSSANPNRFLSTGRIVSVKRNRRPLGPPAQVGALAAEKQGDDDEYHGLPRGNEEAIPSEAELRARMLEREADGDMAQDFFELGQVLGKGGYGSVFLAKDVRSGDLVAIKRFHNNGALVDKKAIKEQNIWKGLHHQNIVEFKGSFVGDNGTLNLVVEYVDGLSLAEHLSQYSAFPETLVAEISRQVLNGLQYLHANGVTHRDLKPANILVDSCAAVKICDFGVSRSENVQTINPGQQHMVGTPWYIAPEMVEYRPYTTSVDIWSLGCTVLELATGRRPYHELSAMQVLFRMVEDRSPPIPQHLSTEAKSFLQACWVWDPKKRPSATDLLKHPFILKARKFSESSKQSSATSSIPESIP